MKLTQDVEVKLILFREKIIKSDILGIVNGLKILFYCLTVIAELKLPEKALHGFNEKNATVSSRQD